MMNITEENNFTRLCGRSGGNQTLHYEQLEDAAPLFHSILTDGMAVSVLIIFFILLMLLSSLINLLTLFGMRQSDDPSCQPRFFFCKNLILSDLMQTATFGPAVIYSLVQRRVMASGNSRWSSCLVKIRGALQLRVTNICKDVQIKGQDLLNYGVMTHFD